jgi:hypothetical protein
MFCPFTSFSEVLGAKFRKRESFRGATAGTDKKTEDFHEDRAVTRHRRVATEKCVRLWPQCLRIQRLAMGSAQFNP